MRSVAIVILNWNGKHFLESFLPTLIGSIDNTLPIRQFIVIADNGSKDGSVDWLKKNHPDVNLIEFKANYGFTGGYNKALSLIKADYFILLNSDVEVSRGWIIPLIHFMESNPEVGACMPKIRSYNNKEYFEYAGACGGFIDKYGYPFCRGRILSNIEKDEGQYDTQMEIFWASGTCFMVRSEIFTQLGGFDENFFAHQEEIDLCWRIQLFGYSVWVIPSSVIYHVGGGTLPNNSPRKLYLNYRNNLLMLYKNLPAKERGKIVFRRMCLDGLSAFVYLLQGKFSFIRAVRRAHKDFRILRDVVEITPESPFKPKGIYNKMILINRHPFSKGIH